MSCNRQSHAASCSCGCLTVGDFGRIVTGVVVGVFGVEILLAFPVLFVALPVLWVLFRLAALVLDVLWTAVLWAGHHLFGMPRPVHRYPGPIPAPPPLSRWGNRAIVATVILYALGIIAAVLSGR